MLVNLQEVIDGGSLHTLLALGVKPEHPLHLLYGNPDTPPMERGLRV